MTEKKEEEEEKEKDWPWSNLEVVLYAFVKYINSYLLFLPTTQIAMCFSLPYNMFRCSTWISQSIWEMHLWVHKGSKEMWVGGFFACEYFGLRDPILLQKYILQYGQIYSIIWIDIFCNLDIYIYKGSRELWVGGFLHVNTLAGEIPFRCTVNAPVTAQCPALVVAPAPN